jgi:phospholipid/cholesterol/gamma-HCH transport system ATP-binding protein
MDQSEPALAFVDINLTFGDNRVLRDVSFEVHPGQTLVLLGAAGSGKTVLLKVALGLLKPDSGRILLFGKDVTDYAERDWFDMRSHIGVLFQEGGLFDSLTIEENVSYPLLYQRTLRCPPDDVQGRVEESLKFVELGHTLAKFPSELSGGMRRRVGIARAVITEPALLLYDSPTAGLDPITATTIMALIVKGRDVRRATTLMATHRYQDGQILAKYRYDSQTGWLAPAEPGNNGNGASAASQTRYMVLREGTLAFLGSPEELEASTDSYVSKFVHR